MKAPAYQMYAQDFDMDTGSWDISEVGIYTRLLNHQWVNGSIPNDIERLCKIARCTKKRFTLGWTIIEKKFVRNVDGNLINLRLEIVRDKQRKYSESRKEQAEKRWIKDNAHAHAHAKHMQCTDDALQSSSSKHKNKKNIIGVIPPKSEDIKAYCSERQNGINAEQFFDYYESRGWMIGKNKMKDWKAAIRTWERNNKENPISNSSTVDAELEEYRKKRLSNV